MRCDRSIRTLPLIAIASLAFAFPVSAGPIANSEGTPITVEQDPLEAIQHEAAESDESSLTDKAEDVRKIVPSIDEQIPQHLRRPDGIEEPVSHEVNAGGLVPAAESERTETLSKGASTDRSAAVVSSPYESLPLGQALPKRRTESASQTGAPTSGAWLVRTTGALAIVVGTILLLKWLVQRLSGRVGSFALQLGPGGRAPSGVLEVLARYPVGRGQSLVLLKVDTRILLLSQTPAGFTTLCVMTDPDEVASLLLRTRDDEGQSMAARFTALLRDAERDPSWIEEDEARAINGPRSAHQIFDDLSSDDDARRQAGTSESTDDDALGRRLAFFRELRA